MAALVDRLTAALLAGLAALLEPMLRRLLAELLAKVLANPAPPRLAYSVGEFCRAYGFKERWVYACIARRELLAYEPNGRGSLRILVSDAEAFVKGHVGVSSGRRERRLPKRLRSPPVVNGAAVTPAKKDLPLRTSLHATPEGEST